MDLRPEMQNVNNQAMVLSRHPIKIFVWNVRGVGIQQCLNNLKEYIRIYKLSFITLLETHISGRRAE